MRVDYSYITFGLLSVLNSFLPSLVIYFTYIYPSGTTAKVVYSSHW